MSSERAKVIEALCREVLTTEEMRIILDCVNGVTGVQMVGLCVGYQCSCRQKLQWVINRFRAYPNG